MLPGAAATVVGWRLWAPTRDGWILFPYREGNLICLDAERWLRGQCYGEREMHAALADAASYAADLDPEIKIAYMDASRRDGGRMARHNSHLKGIDVDVLFIDRGADRSWYPDRQAIFSAPLPKYGRDGMSGDRALDVVANWRFLEGLRQNKHREVHLIFVAPSLKTLLLAEGKKIGISAETLEWGERVLAYAGEDAGPHDDHYHIRFKGKGSE